MSAIGSLNEKSLHWELKNWLARPGDSVEVSVDGYVIDLVRGDLLIEVQTRNFSALRTKMRRLIETHHVRLVHPVAVEKWIVKLPAEPSEEPVRRKSPKRGSLLNLFDELVSLPDLLIHPKFSLQVLLIREEEVRRFDGRRGWRRRGWVTHERRLQEVLEEHIFSDPQDLNGLLPGQLPDPFTTGDLSTALGVHRELARKMAYCLSRLGGLRRRGKRGNAILYSLKDIDSART